MEIKYRICKTCNKNKELFAEFYFHSATGYYQGTCKECQCLKRRENHTSLPKKERKIPIKFKICLKCSKRKEINFSNFRKLGNHFSGVCMICSDKEKENKLKERLNVGPLSLDSIKQCIICKTHKNISDFSFSRGIGYYSSYCKTCDVKRKQERVSNFSKETYEKLKEYGRNWHKINKHKSLLTVYKKFDFHRNLENDLTKEYIKEKILKSCSYCGHPSTGLDRIDNSKGHLQSNCISCCWECNTARNDNFSYDEMLIIGKSIKQIKDNRNQ